MRMAGSQGGGRDLIAVLKEAVAGCGLSLNQLAKECGVSQPQLSRFMSGDRMLSLPSAAKLFEFFNLEVISRTAKKPAPKKLKK